MLVEIHPKLPMRDKFTTRDFYLKKRGFQIFGSEDYDGHLMVQKDKVNIHFFEYRELNPKENYGQVYIRTNEIDKLYQLVLDAQLNIPSAGLLAEPEF